MLGEFLDVINSTTAPFFQLYEVGLCLINTFICLLAGNVLTTASPPTTVTPPLSSETPDNCTFETETCGWVNVDLDKPVWTRQSGTSAGPSTDHTTGQEGAKLSFDLASIENALRHCEL